MIPQNGLMKTSIQSPQIIYLKICIGNHMILSAIWNNKNQQITRTYRASAICGL